MTIKPIKAWGIKYGGKITDKYFEFDIFKTKSEAKEFSYEGDEIVQVEIREVTIEKGK